MGIAAFAALPACSPHREKPSCPAPEPAFRLELVAPDGPLPPDTRVEVAYGGEQTATYSLKTASSTNEDLCCRPGEPSPSPLPHVSCGDTVADGGAPHALLCELWTDGTTELEVRAAGYGVVDRVLSSKLDEQHCGVVTVDAHIVLQYPDGGT